MSVRFKVGDLKAGDRVLLSCPAAGGPGHEAQFAGVHRSVEEAMCHLDAAAPLPEAEAAAEFMSSGHLGWASFLMHTHGDGAMVYAGFRVEPDGGLREMHGKRVIIERRLGRVGVG